MDLSEKLEHVDHEQVIICRDRAADYLAIIAIHSTALGPAVGGTRLWHYPSFDAALTDALRLSRGMTYKNALADLPFGGGKSVLLAPAPGEPAEGPRRDVFFRAHGRFIGRLHGLYIAAEDVGTTPADMATVAGETPHVAGLSSGVGDPSPFTARGVCRAIEAAATVIWGHERLEGRTVAIQGLGRVGRHLAAELAKKGARLLVTDVDPSRVRPVVVSLGALAIPPDAVFDVPVDIFAPCALGGVLQDDTIPRLRARAVVGAANNQLLEPRHGDALAARQILYVPTPPMPAASSAAVWTLPAGIAVTWKRASTGSTIRCWTCVRGPASGRPRQPAPPIGSRRGRSRALVGPVERVGLVGLVGNDPDEVRLGALNLRHPLPDLPDLPDPPDPPDLPAPPALPALPALPVRPASLIS